MEQKISTPPFDHNNLIGKEFVRYQQFVVSLEQASMYDFDEYKAAPKLAGNNDLIGIQILEPQPIRKVRISMKDAIMHNLQILNSQGRSGQGKYLLLQQNK